MTACSYLIITDMGENQAYLIWFSVRPTGCLSWLGLGTKYTGVFSSVEFAYKIKNKLKYKYCIIYAEQHQAFDDFGCSREVLFLEGSFSMVNVLGGGDFFAARER